MTTITEGRYPAEFLASEAAGNRSREQGVLLSGQNVKAGHVLGQVAHGTASVAGDAGNTAGAGTVGTITLGAGIKAGKYVATCIEPGTNAGKFAVEDPDGVNLGVATVAVAFAAGGLGFTITDATDFVAGDRFTITVALGSGKFKEWNSANTDGSEVVAALAYANVDATSADHDLVVIVRDAEVNGAVLEYFADADDAAKAIAKAQLAAKGIIVR